MIFKAVHRNVHALIVEEGERKDLYLCTYKVYECNANHKMLLITVPLYEPWDFPVYCLLKVPVVLICAMIFWICFAEYALYKLADLIIELFDMLLVGTISFFVLKFSVGKVL